MLVEVGFRNGKFDALGESVKQSIIEDLNIKTIEKVSYSEGFLLPESFSQKQAEELAVKLFHDPINQIFSVNSPVKKDSSFVITVQYHSNVTDNVGIAAEEGIKDLGFEFKKNEHVRSLKKYYLYGSLSEKEAEEIASGLLANKLVEEFDVKKC